MGKAEGGIDAVGKVFLRDEKGVHAARKSMKDLTQFLAPLASLRRAIKTGI